MAALGWLLNLGFGGTAAEAAETPFWTAVAAQSTTWTDYPAPTAVAATGQAQRLALLRAGAGGVLPVTLPIPDGEIDMPDREHLLGIASPGGSVSADPGTIWTDVERHEP